MDEEGVTGNKNILKIQPGTYGIELLYFSSYEKTALFAKEKLKGQVNLISLVTKTKKNTRKCNKFTIYPYFIHSMKCFFIKKNKFSN